MTRTEPIRLRDLGPVAGNLLGSGILAFAASMVMLFITGPATQSATPWRSESVASFLAAATWMTVGLLAARRFASIAAPFLFVAGAGVAWFLATGIVYGVSPYYGLFPVVCGCLGGMLAWALHHRRHSMRERVIAVVFPLVITALVTGKTLLLPTLPDLRQVVLADARQMHLPVVHADSGAWNSLYIWASGDIELVNGAQATLRIETDPGSGGSEYFTVEATDTQHLRIACARFRAIASDQVNGEIARGSIPAFMRAIPIRYPVCEKGRVWLATGTLARTP